MVYDVYMKTATAPSISRALHAAGLRTVADHSREGMRVRSGEPYISVVAQFDSEAQAIALATDAAEILRAAGYRVEQADELLKVWK